MEITTAAGIAGGEPTGPGEDRDQSSQRLPGQESQMGNEGSYEEDGNPSGGLTGDENMGEEEGSLNSGSGRQLQQDEVEKGSGYGAPGEGSGETVPADDEGAAGSGEEEQADPDMVKSN
ncbi:hypothetical protein DJ568_09070 [Mucilaginibacter hurinus]|uniref:Uncharacterized protein n=1 Tax=Mucilaginibacter hurinus TaxID=2201324 RepID=A0A367GRJ3_9SPHI|nr:hypothetical protein [Mucilaginibacter hurinus]RCH55321.1 hypothetical protein DJ568_09070 [Mucilaginibacter hurinus]